MKEHLKVSMLLCIYGVFKEFRPSEPYLVPYMTGPPLNFTAEQVSQDIFPVCAYSSAILLVVVFLITDFLRYKIIIILQAISAISTYLMLIMCRGIFQMQMMQVVYGFYTAAEVAYFTYIYAKVDSEYFQEVTSYTRSAYLVGKSLSGMAAQACVYYDLASYTTLLWITVASETLAAVCAILLPSVDRSMYFHRKHINVREEMGRPAASSGQLRTVSRILWHDFKTAFTSLYVVKWSVWSALATAGYYMVTSYNQVLWTSIRSETGDTRIQLNGLVETSYTLLGALGSMLVGRIKVNWQRLGEPLLAVFSLVLAALLAAESQTTSVYIAYVMFVLYGIIFQTMITVSNSEVAKHINRDSYALVFGVNNFVVLLLMSVASYLVLQLLQLDARPQFEVYSLYFGVLGFIFMISFITTCVRSNLT